MRKLKRYRIPGTRKKKEEKATVFRRRDGIIYPIKFTVNKDNDKVDLGFSDNSPPLLNTV